MSVFRRLARRITVADLQSAIGPSLRADMNYEEAWKACDEADGKQGYDSVLGMCLVVDKTGTPTHYCSPGQIDPDGTVGDCAEPLNPTVMISGDTTALSAVKLLGTPERQLAFVLHENHITGILTWEDFYKPEFRICVLSVLFEVEQTCLDVALRDPASSWAQLSPGRQTKAREAYAMQCKRDSADASLESLLQYTYFCDKQKLIQNETTAVGLTKKWLRVFFEKAEMYRNCFAHVGGEEPFDVRAPGKLARLISDAERFVALFKLPEEPTIRLVR